MKKLKFGFQGLSGAYHEKAAKIYLERNEIGEKRVEFVSCDVFEQIFEKVENGEFDLGVVAVENSLMGSIYKNFDLLQKHDLKIVGEVYVHVKHQLYSLPNAKKSDIKEVVSQYMAILQCDEKLKLNFPNIKRTEYFDTIAASKFVKETNNKEISCISPEGIGESYGLKRLISNFNDDENNYTRFLVINKNYAKFAPTTPAVGHPSSGRRGSSAQGQKFKTSIIFRGENVAGFLYKALGCFAMRDISLSKIESRPIPKTPWNYFFYFDFEGKYDDVKVMNAINNLKEFAQEVKILGSYVADKI